MSSPIADRAKMLESLVYSPTFSPMATEQNPSPVLGQVEALCENIESRVSSPVVSANNSPVEKQSPLVRKNRFVQLLVLYNSTVVFSTLLPLLS
jgi:hypothetical protein